MILDEPSGQGEGREFKILRKPKKFETNRWFLFVIIPETKAEGFIFQRTRPVGGPG